MDENLVKQHPFLDGLKNPPQGRTKELQKMRNWLTSQPHLPTISDEFIYLFLHANYYHVDRSKQMVENYFMIRTNTPMLFANRDAYRDELKNCMNLAYCVRLPQLTPEGYRILLYTVKDPDFSKLVFEDAVKAFCMFNDCLISEDGLVDGYIIVLDMKDVQLGHFARVSLPPLKAFMLYIQEAHPGRLIGIHVLNTTNYIHHLMRIVMPLVRSEFLSFVKFHKDDNPEGLPLELLPEEYGGKAGSVKELDEAAFSLVDKYRDWLLQTEKFKVDESKRAKKMSWWNFLSGTTPTSPNIESKEGFLANLKIE